MAQPALGTSVTAEILSSLPQAVDPLALSLNESPFAPLPAVRSALAHSLDVANRYPEFLPGQLRRMIADRVGVDEERGWRCRCCTRSPAPVTGLSWARPLSTATRSSRRWPG